MRYSLVILIILFNLFLAKAQTFSLEDVVPGLSGYALTAGQGNLIERFPVEVIGVQLDAGSGFPLVLVKASGSFIEATGGVAAGMSGSPVYLPTPEGDAILGAIGFVFPNADHQLALVTPIELMRGASAASLSFTPSGQAFAELGAIQAVATPVLLSGLSERASEQLEPLFKTSITPFPVQLSSGLAWDEDAYSLEPGSAVSVQLVRGDVTIAAVGTVTEVQGDRILAFGHPLLGEGSVSFALAPAFVSYIVPSIVVPFKLANNGVTALGTITEDRPPAISGVLGQESNFLPVTLTFVSETQSITKRVEIVNDERYYAPLLASATLQLFDDLYQKTAGGTASIAWDVGFKNGSSVRVLEQITHPRDITRLSAVLTAQPLRILAENIFATPDVERVAINIEYSEAENYAEIIELVAEQEELDEGEDVVLFVRLQPYRGEPEVKTLRLTLPEGVSGELELTVRGGMEPSNQAPNDTSEAILSFAELLAALRGNVESSELSVETIIDDKTERLERLRFPFLVQGEASVRLTIGDVEMTDGASQRDTTEDDAANDEPDPEKMLP